MGLSLCELCSQFLKESIMISTDCAGRADKKFNNCLLICLILLFRLLLLLFLRLLHFLRNLKQQVSLFLYIFPKFILLEFFSCSSFLRVWNPSYILFASEYQFSSWAFSFSFIFKVFIGILPLFFLITCPFHPPPVIYLSPNILFFNFELLFRTVCSLLVPLSGR
jgi:hypothetical protein